MERGVEAHFLNDIGDGIGLDYAFAFQDEGLFAGIPSQVVNSKELCLKS